MRRRLTFLIALLFVIAGCREPEPGSREAIERDLDRRGVRQLYDEAEAIAFTAPEDGLLTDAHVESYVRVRALAKEIAAVATERLDEQVESAARDDNRMSRMAAAFSGLGNARAILSAETRAAMMLGANPHEFFWVAARVRESIPVYRTWRWHEERVAERLAAYEAETDEVLRERKDAEWKSADGAKTQWLAGIDDVTLANSETVEAHETKLAPYHPEIRKSQPAAS